MTAPQRATTVSVLSLLILLYGLTIYFGAKNTLNFLVRQKRYKVPLLTAFYSVSLALCVFRII